MDPSSRRLSAKKGSKDSKSTSGKGGSVKKEKEAKSSDKGSKDASISRSHLSSLAILADKKIDNELYQDAIDLLTPSLTILEESKQSCIKAGTTGARVFNARGAAYSLITQKVRDQRRAIADFTSALVCDKTDRGAVVGRARCYLRLKLFKTAIEGLSYVIDKPASGSKAELLYDRAQCYAKLDPPENEKALVDLDKCWKLVKPLKRAPHWPPIDSLHQLRYAVHARLGGIHVASAMEDLNILCDITQGSQRVEYIAERVRYANEQRELELAKELAKDNGANGEQKSPAGHIVDTIPSVAAAAAVPSSSSSSSSRAKKEGKSVKRPARKHGGDGTHQVKVKEPATKRNSGSVLERSMITVSRSDPQLTSSRRNNSNTSKTGSSSSSISLMDRDWPVSLHPLRHLATLHASHGDYNAVMIQLLRAVNACRDIITSPEGNDDNTIAINLLPILMLKCGDVLSLLCHHNLALRYVATVGGSDPSSTTSKKQSKNAKKPTKPSSSSFSSTRWPVPLPLPRACFTGGNDTMSSSLISFAWYWQSIIYRRSKNLEMALECIDQALIIDELSWRYMYQRGVIRYYDYHDDCIVWFERAIARAQTVGDTPMHAWYRLAKAYYRRRHEPGRALHLFEQCWEHVIDDASLLPPPTPNNDNNDATKHSSSSSTLCRTTHCYARPCQAALLCGEWIGDCHAAVNWWARAREAYEAASSRFNMALPPSTSSSSSSSSPPSSSSLLAEVASDTVTATVAAAASTASNDISQAMDERNDEGNDTKETKSSSISTSEGTIVESTNDTLSSIIATDLGDDTATSSAAASSSAEAAAAASTSSPAVSLSLSLSSSSVLWGDDSDLVSDSERDDDITSLVAIEGVPYEKRESLRGEKMVSWPSAASTSRKKIINNDDTSMTSSSLSSAATAPSSSSVASSLGRGRYTGTKTKAKSKSKTKKKIAGREVALTLMTNNHDTDTSMMTNMSAPSTMDTNAAASTTSSEASSSTPTTASTATMTIGDEGQHAMDELDPGSPPSLPSQISSSQASSSAVTNDASSTNGSMAAPSSSSSSLSDSVASQPTITPMTDDTSLSNEPTAVAVSSTPPVSSPSPATPPSVASSSAATVTDDTTTANVSTRQQTWHQKRVGRLARLERKTTAAKQHRQLTTQLKRLRTRKPNFAVAAAAAAAGIKNAATSLDAVTLAAVRDHKFHARRHSSKNESSSSTSNNTATSNNDNNKSSTPMNESDNNDDTDTDDGGDHVGVARLPFIKGKRPPRKAHKSPPSASSSSASKKKSVKRVDASSAAARGDDTKSESSKKKRKTSQGKAAASSSTTPRRKNGSDNSDASSSSSSSSSPSSASSSSKKSGHMTLLQAGRHGFIPLSVPRRTATHDDDVKTKITAKRKATSSAIIPPYAVKIQAAAKQLPNTSAAAGKDDSNATVSGDDDDHDNDNDDGDDDDDDTNGKTGSRSLFVRRVHATMRSQGINMVTLSQLIQQPHRSIQQALRVGRGHTITMNCLRAWLAQPPSKDDLADAERARLYEAVHHGPHATFRLSIRWIMETSDITVASVSKAIGIKEDAIVSFLNGDNTGNSHLHAQLKAYIDDIVASRSSSSLGERNTL